MNKTAEALATLRKYLEETQADPEIFAAFDLVRNEYTKLMGLCIMMNGDIESRDIRSQQ